MQLSDCFLRLKVSKLLKLYIMILSTTPTIEGHTIREYKGVVTGDGTCTHDGRQRHRRHRSRLRDHRRQRFYANGSRQRHSCGNLKRLPPMQYPQGFVKAEVFIHYSPTLLSR